MTKIEMINEIVNAANNERKMTDNEIKHVIKRAMRNDKFYISMWFDSFKNNRSTGHASWIITALIH